MIVSAFQTMQKTFIGWSPAHRFNSLAVNPCYREESSTVLLRDINHGAAIVVRRVRSGCAFFLVKSLVVVGIVNTGIVIVDEISVSTRNTIEKLLPEGKIIVA